MNTMNYVFDATQHEPSSNLPPIPGGSYGLTITGVAIEPMRDDKGDTFVVTSQVNEGEYQGRTLRKRYNLWHKLSAENVKISHQELSALCHVTNVLRLDFNNGGAALVGARYRGMVINDGTYNEIKGVFDVNGNAPGRGGMAAPLSAPAPVAVVSPQQPQQFAAQPAFNAPQQPQQPAPAAYATAPQQAPAFAAPQQMPQPVQQGWSQAAAPAAAPWGQPAA